jgi:hypothetical protein
MEMNPTTRPEEVTMNQPTTTTTTQENLAVYTGKAGSTDRNIVRTVATFGADTHVGVGTCDGRPESQIDEVSPNAVRMTVNSSCWTDEGTEARVTTTTALTAKQALSVARDLIAHAQQLMPNEG